MAVPGVILDRVRDTIGQPRKRAILQLVDDTARVNTSFDAKLLKQGDCIAEILADPTIPEAPKSRKQRVDAVLEELRPRKQGDSYEVQRLYTTLEQKVNQVFEEDWRAERGVRKNRIAYLN